MKDQHLAKRVLRWVVPVRDDEIAALSWAVAYFFFLMLGYYPLRPLRENMGVEGGIENIAWLWTGTLVAVIALNPIFCAIVARFPRRTFIPYVYRFFITNLLVFFVLFKVFPQGQPHMYLGRVFYIWLSVFNLFVMSVGWGFMADIFSNPQSRRLFGFIASGASLGGTIGSALVILLVDYIDPFLFMLLGAVLLEGAVRTVGPLNRIAISARQRTDGQSRRPKEQDPAADAGSKPHQPIPEQSSFQTTPDEPIRGTIWEGMVRVAKSPYLMGIALFMFFWSASGTFMYLVQAEIAATYFVEELQRIKFFAGVNFWVNVFSLFGQAWLVSRVIKALGVGLTLALLPIVVFAGFAILGTSLSRLEPATLIWVFIVLETTRKVANYSLARPTREILYTVVPRAEKYKSKTFIDTFVVRTSDPINGWINMGLRALGLSTASVLFVVMPIAGVWFVLALALGARQNRLAKCRRCDTCGNTLSSEDAQCPACGAAI
ncbi:MAG: MFS transporter [Phycisphaerales bacterium]